MGLGMWPLDLNLHPHKATFCDSSFCQELFIDYPRNRECDHKQDLALWVSMETGTRHQSRVSSPAQHKVGVGYEDIREPLPRVPRGCNLTVV